MHRNIKTHTVSFLCTQNTHMRTNIHKHTYSILYAHEKHTLCLHSKHIRRKHIHNRTRCIPHTCTQNNTSQFNDYKTQSVTFVIMKDSKEIIKAVLQPHQTETANAQI